MLVDLAKSSRERNELMSSISQTCLISTALFLTKHLPSNLILKRSFFSYPLFLIFLTVYELSAAPCRVVLDPGHGGMYISPTRIYGDKFDVQKGHFLDSYKAGARHPEIYEHERVYRIGAGIKELLVKSRIRLRLRK